MLTRKLKEEDCAFKIDVIVFFLITQEASFLTFPTFL